MKMRYRKPDDLKEADIEWSGDIPYGWDTTKLKFQTIVNMGQSPPSDGYNKKGIGTAFLQGNADFTDKYPQTESFTDNGNKFCQKEDILFSVRAPVGEINIADKKYCIGRGLCSIAPKDVDSRFLWHYLHIAKKELKAISTGSTFESVSSEDVKNLSLLLPPLPEQRSIAAFLDRKTEAIDGLIQKKEQLIERLKEQRQALITRAVTKGLDPDPDESGQAVPMKDSGIEWLGKIPEHWKKVKLKYLTNIFGRIGYRGYTTDDIVDKGEGAISLSPSNIKNDQLVLSQNTYISWNKYHESPEIKIYEDDIVLVKTGSTIGKTAIVPKNTPEMTINPQLVVLKDIRCSPEFLYYVTASPMVKYAFEVGQAGGSTPSISQEKIENFSLVVPPTKKEQIEIIEYLNSEEQYINSVIMKTENVIRKLKEYRQSLISAAVTGKIDVRS